MLTTNSYRFIALITVLSAAHHVDHVLRDVTGWPFTDEFNPFSASLFVYPVLAAGVVLSKRGRAGPAFWVVLAGGAAVFLAVIHVGPAAGDAVEDIPDGYASAAADVAALVVLAGLVLALVGHAAYEWRTLRARNP